MDEPPPSPPPPKSAARPKAAAPMPLPPPPPPPPPSASKFAFDVVEKPKKKPAVEEDEDEDEDDRPKSKRRRDDDDEEDDRPRKKSRREEDDDDYDDRPRSKRRRDDDDDDDYDDRPRSKRRRDDDDDYDDDYDDRPRKRRRDYDDEDDDWHRAPKKKGPAGFAAAKTGVLLLNISFWLHGVSLALLSFFIFLALVGAFDGSSSSSSTSRRPPQRGGFNNDDDYGSSRSGSGSAEFIAKLPGFLGVANWIVAGVGFGFCIAGPVKARAMAITAASLAGAHLILAGVSISHLGGAVGGFGAMGGGGDVVMWLLWATTLPILDTLFPILIMGGTRGIGSDYVLAFLAAGCELARMIFAMLMVKRLAEAAKDYEAEEKAQLGVMGAVVAGGGSAILALLVTLIYKTGAIDGMTSAKIFGGGSILLIYLAFTAMNAMPIFATMTLRRSLGRKARGK
ncbi:MAG: hypothetical protein K8U57_11550 [Planctomycetes bacterium]|nr:hypothetical protein [Planctomycetota bacterium]